MFLCEADQFISLTSLLDEEDREDNGIQKDVLSDACGELGEAWCKLAALPKFIYYMSFIRPSTEAVPDLIGSVHMPDVGDDDDDDETLLGALLEDSRVAPFLLQDGRP
ncbi:hypothetical protein FMUND_84 [Fusarium mundagurra]|uniref:Uncharacterized protein n=1 Tax=Fusarium mundagurra TaxID=1567541 RepID=A0A8H5Z8V4_9HYPO|nr:hypothetical protein FMUND_84 [Fusarium mundagurra]